MLSASAQARAQKEQAFRPAVSVIVAHFIYRGGGWGVWNHLGGGLVAEIVADVPQQRLLVLRGVRSAPAPRTATPHRIAERGAMSGKAIRAASRRLTLVDGSIWQSLGMIFFNRSPARRRRGSAA